MKDHNIVDNVREGTMIVAKGVFIKNAYQSSWNRATGSGVLTKLLGMKVHEIEDSITILFSNGLIIENFLRKEINTNANPIHVLDNLLTARGKDFVKYLKG